MRFVSDACALRGGIPNMACSSSLSMTDRAISILLGASGGSKLYDDRANDLTKSGKLKLGIQKGIVARRCLCSRDCACGRSSKISSLSELSMMEQAVLMRASWKLTSYDGKNLILSRSNPKKAYNQPKSSDICAHGVKYERICSKGRDEFACGARCSS